ncbi:hypothetical protein [Streptomyces sp. NBC_01190]|uniref:hypothetical protein n=1 Tax=Streptomyces sp. NBC_01190 TaxID=2903767 RepID=UPI00386B09DD|nr:hypothetical protein OG519_17720 [Streptomyces sp. NBC_01190]
MESTALLSPSAVAATSATLAETDTADHWSHPLPLHFARLAGDPAEPHILRGLD